MHKPSWVNVVGILGIIFGCSGILGAGQEIFMPKIMKMQMEFLTSIEKSETKPPSATQKENSQSPQGNKPARTSPPKEMINFMRSLFAIPDWVGPWIVLTGIAKALISALYLLAAIWLLQIKPIAIRLFYVAAGASIVLGIIKGIVALSALSIFMGAFIMGWGSFGALIDLILIIVVATGDKEAFYPESSSAPARA